MSTEQYPQGPYPQNPYPQYPAPPEKKKRKKWPWIVLGIFVVIIGSIGGCMAMVGGVANEIDKESKKEVEVVYRVKGTGTPSVTFSSENFNLAQESDVRLPWTKTVKVTGFGKTASLTATNGSESNSTVTCEIVVDGQVKSTQTARGSFASAHCGYNVPSS